MVQGGGEEEATEEIANAANGVKLLQRYIVREGINDKSVSHIL